MLDFLYWFLIIEVLAWAIFPCIAVLLPQIPDRGWGISKPLGAYSLAICLWMVDSASPLSSSRSVTFALFLALIALGGLMLRKNWNYWKQFFQYRKKELITAEVLFCSTAVFFLLIRAFQPEIYWGEKPMDSSFLQYFVRLDHLPPEDPWAAGQHMQYYYFGYYLFASIHKLSGIPPAVGYNLTIITLPAFLVVSLYTVFSSIGLSTLRSSISSLAVIFLSNLEAAHLLFVRGETADSNLLWATTRVFKSPGISEYPLWTYLFADLHPHAITLPYTVVLLALGIELLRPEMKISRRMVVHRLCYGLLWSSFLLMNSWDFISYALPTALFLLFRPFLLQSNNWLQNLRETTVHYLLIFCEFCILLLPASLFFFSILGSNQHSTKVYTGWVGASEFNTFSQFIRVLGVWIVPSLLGYLFILLFTKSISRKSKYMQGAKACILGSIPLAAALACHLKGTSGIPWGIVLSSSLLILLSTMVSWQKNASNALRLLGVCTVSASLLIVGSELFFLMDRMNTLFKFYNAVWTLLGISATALCWKLYFPSSNPQTNAQKITELWPARTLTLVVMLLSVLCTSINLYINSFTTLHWSISGPRPTLDGTAFLKNTQSDDAAAIHWLNTTIRGTPTLLEAFGPSYQKFTRICTYTGIPVLLGWEHHVSQRGTKWSEIRRRKRDIKTIYSSTNVEIAQKLLDRYHVALIVIGAIEQSHYPAPGLAKFSRDPEMFPLLFKSGETNVYGYKDHYRTYLANVSSKE